jgi:hypothetical protein
MRKPLCLFVAFFLGFAVAAEAGVHLSLAGGYAATPDQAPGEGVVVCGSVGFSLSKALSLDLTVGRWEVPIRGTDSGLSQGRLTEIPIALELRVHIPLGPSRFGAYVAGGLGYALHSFELDSGFAGGWRTAGLEVRENADHGPAGHVGAGFEIALGPAVALEVGARYTILRTKGDWSMADLVGDENVGGRLDNLNFDALAVVVGFRVAIR